LPNALLAKRKLSAKQVDKLIGRSVNDVKVNAPTPRANKIIRDPETESAMPDRRRN
jgi:hypothetical protein